jgi:UPF0042 nucleotide-binding protein
VTPELLVITGMSGAGRSTAAKALEDLGWYVVDNLPPQLIAELAALTARAEPVVTRIAVSVDVRGRSFFSEIADALKSADAVGMHTRLLFLDATDEALVRRFESVRRPHPLQGDGTLLDGITAERSRVAGVREASDIIVDTSDLNIHQLANLVTDTFAEADRAGLQVAVQSFGFKYGVPADADLVADARFLPNPFWQDELRPLTGEDQRVSDYVLDQPGAREFLDAYVEALRPVLEGYQRENKRHAMIAIGCTGGKHRSVAMVRELAARLRSIPGLAVSVKHRDLGRE